MPNLTPEQHARLQEIYLQALRLPARDRELFVRSEFANDAAMLDAYHELGDGSNIPTAFLDPIADELVAGFQAEESKWRDPARIGPNVGRYRLLSLLGEGGFGMVYEAEQTEPVRRRVALKIIKPGQDSRAVISRFEAERQALALMDHPFIAKILDGGTTGPESGHQGLPYFVMELVRGDPITTFCDRERLTIAQRLELMSQVCDAVEHAHKRGIIHRDLKPSNVLVAFHDGNAVPKIIDFGIAKAISSGLTEHTLYTMRGQLIGTPAYMSPEQAEMSGVEIDERTDVYSLGVLLYEVLTSRPPFDPRSLHSAGHAEMVRIIREVAPQRPSTRLSTQIDGEEGHAAALAVAKARRAELNALTRQLRSDLDWVVMKCLEKERDRRYGSAGELSDELRRILNHEPVEAGPPSLRYRARKFSKRNRGPLVWTAALVLVTTAFTAFSAVQWQRNEALARTIRQGAAFADAISTEIQGGESADAPAFEGAAASPLPGVLSAQEESELREFIERRSSEQALTQRQKDLGFLAIAAQLEELLEFSIPATEENKVLLAHALLLHADIVQGLRRPGLGDADLARRGYERAARIAAAIPARNGRGAGIAARASQGVGDTFRGTDIVAAENAYRSALTELETILADAAGDPVRLSEAESKLDSAERDLVVALSRQCLLAQADRLLVRSVATRRERAARQHEYLVDELSAQRFVAVGLSTLAELRMLQQRLPEAEQAALESLELRQSLLPTAIRSENQILNEFEHKAVARGGTISDAAAQRDRVLDSFRRDVEVSRMIVARAKSLRGDHPGARELLGLADGRLAALHQESPEDDRLADTRLMLALDAARNELAAEDAMDALTWTERAAEHLVHLDGLSGGRNSSLERRRAETAYLDGRALALAGRAEAMARLGESVDLYESLVALDPAQSEYARMLGRSLAALAEARLFLAPARADTQALARSEFERARELFDNWNNQGPICAVTEAERVAVLEGLGLLAPSDRP